jgi:hypothetical protein
MMHWMPLLVLALVLRYSVSLALTLQVAAVVGVAAVLAINYLVPGIDSLWSALLNELVTPVLLDADIPPTAIALMLEQAAQLGTGIFVAAFSLSVTLALLVARWWQALLYNPGGFREEFTSLQLGYLAGGLTLALTAGALLTKASLMIELAIVAAVMFFLQGMAVAHTVIATFGYAALYMAGLYGLLMLALPQMMTALSMLGTTDAFIDFRGRLREKIK